MKTLKRFSADIIARHRACCQPLVVKHLDALMQRGGFGCPVQRRYLNRVRSFVEEEDGLVAEPKVLRRVVEEFEKVYFRFGSLESTMFEPVNKELEEVFNYKTFCTAEHTTKDKWGGVPLMREILSRVRYCPYCNAETVYVVERNEDDNDRKPIKSAYDHFFPQGRYPFLALSIYNLIPSCYRCNSQFKRDEFKSLLAMPHPYIEDVDNMACFVPLNIGGAWFSESLDVDLKIEFVSKDPNGKEAIANYDKLFNISNVYSQLFKREAADAIIKSKVLNQSYLALLKDFFASAGMKSVDVERLLLGVSSDRSNINNERLSKLIHDIRDMFTQSVCNRL